MPSYIANVLLSVLAFIAMHGGVQAAVIEPCGANSIKSERHLWGAGKGDDLRIAPTAKSEKIIHENKIFESKDPVSITRFAAVIEECTQGEWSRVYLKNNKFLMENEKTGWVRSKTLRVQKVDSQGFIEYTDADFEWDSNTKPHKKLIIEGINRIHRKNPRCRTLDASSAELSTLKGSKTAPVFYVTCTPRDGVFNVFFSKSEIQ